MAYNLALEFILSGKPNRIMELLTDPILIRKWSGSNGFVENKIDGKVSLFDDWVTGKVLKTSKNELSYTWKTTDWDDETEPSVVHFLLQEDEAGTKVILTHTNLPTEDEMKSHKSGWTDYFFDPMEDFILIIDKS